MVISKVQSKRCTLCSVLIQKQDWIIFHIFHGKFYYIFERFLSKTKWISTFAGI